MHIKRQITSLTGSFQVITGLGTYYVFIASLDVGFSSRLPINSLSQSAPQVAQLTSEFSHLKILGHMYVVEDAWDLARS
jgi:recyclin-1